MAIVAVATSVRCTGSEFACSDDAQCQGAGPVPRCEDGACSFEDAACDGGRRYASGSPLAGQCVPSGGSSSSTSTEGLDLGGVSGVSGVSGSSGVSGGSGALDTLGLDTGSPPGTTEGVVSTTGTDGPPLAVELCNGFDDDMDGLVDEVSPDNLECGGCWLEQFEDHAYWICPEGRPWSEAVEDCVGFGAELAWIDSPEENAVITELAGGFSLWLGASDLEQEGDWRWLDGSVLDVGHSAWGPGQPDDDGPQPAGEDCLHLSSARLFGDGDWNDDICEEQPYGALCKAPHVPSP